MTQEFDQKKLAENDGSNGKPTYIARHGKVYDVSESKLWRNGEHMKRHRAGLDLSDVFSEAPHGTEVFERYPQIGILQGGTPGTSEETAEQPQGPQWLTAVLDRYPVLKRHPHPALVHFPIAFMFGATMFSLLALISDKASFSTTAFHCLGIGILMTPLTIGSGFFTWWLNYQGQWIKQVKIKIIGSVILMLLMTFLFIWHYFVPALLFSPGGQKVLYLLLILTLFPLVSVIGWYGATLTFPVGKKEE
jgi:predicted heme/steroid binding protein/uncharacterized membrane protein